MSPRELAQKLERLGYCACGCGARSSMSEDGRGLLSHASAMLVALSEEVERSSTLLRQVIEDRNCAESDFAKGA